MKSGHSLKDKYAHKEEQIGDEAMRTYERIIMLNIIDAQWKDHLLSLGSLKTGNRPGRLRTERSTQ